MASDEVTVNGIHMSREVYELSKDQFGPSQPPAEANRALRAANRDSLESDFDGIWRLLGGSDDDWLHNYQFDTDSSMEIDRYHPAAGLGVEIDGGQYMRKSGHSNMDGLERDAMKGNRCNELGIELWRLTTSMVDYDEVARIRDRVIERTKNDPNKINQHLPRAG